ncbi:hypothetical protein M758_5G068900 [Ceratodon purpureus]|nr:hypothetical protein M758_5G068900 [Ceratodon purpureus]
MEPSSEDDCALGLSTCETNKGEGSSATGHGEIHEDGVHQRNLVHTDSDIQLQAKHKVFLSYSGAQKDFVEQLCVDLERCDRYPFYAKRKSSLPIGEAYPQLIFNAIQQCEVGVLVLSKEFFTNARWPMVELVAMVKELKKPNPIIKIIPVFCCISREDWLDIENRTAWVLRWNEWASNDTRINIDEWKEALEILKTINSIINTSGEVDLREKIVDAVCALVDPETKLNDSHVQGKSRLCKVVCEKINQQMQQNGVRVIGLHGIGGIGKTTICKAMCNEMSKEFHGKVCHIELKSSTEAVQLLRELLKRLTKSKHDIVDRYNIDECHNQLNKGVVNQPIFLAIDNVVSDDRENLKQAKTYLGTRWIEGSVVMVTARSLNDLTYLKPHINESDCMGVPELTKDDAMALFQNHVKSADATIKIDEQLLNRCVERCCFSKGANQDCHYIPLALEVLGEELASVGYDSRKWDVRLKKIDTFEKALSQKKHPIFSILRTSYESLDDEAKMLFMDVALFLPCVQYQSWHWGCFLKCNLYDWLGMVHGSKVKEMLNQLKQKSLLEDLGDGWTKIGMHDLWREFCVAEAKAKKYEYQRWMFLEEESGELNCSWKDMKRMRFLNEGWKGLKEVNFDECVNVSVLKVNIQWFVEPSKITLDFKGLKHLKSLELKANKFLITCDGFGSLKNLVILKWWADKATSSCIEEIGSLTKLQVLEIKGFDGDTLPNIGKLKALQVVCFAHCDNVVTITGLSSNLFSLKSLCISRCSKLQECPGLDELYDLEELDMWGCNKLKSLPSLQRLTKLSHLNISECILLKEVLGLIDSTALKVLQANGCYGLGHLPSMQKATQLEVLRCTDLSRIDSLDLDEFPQLQEGTFGWLTALKMVTCSKYLSKLTIIDLTLCLSLEGIPDLSHFPNLQKLILQGCAHSLTLSSCAPMPTLRVLDLEGCKKLSELPEQLSCSTDLEVLCLQKSGIIMSEEEEMKLKASCEKLVVFHSSNQSKYGDNYHGEPTNLTHSRLDIDIDVQHQFRSKRLWDPLPREKITKLIYSNNGSRLQTRGEMNLLALTSSGMHKRWDWKNQARVVVPQFWQPIGSVLMINDINSTTHEEAQPCSMALCNDNDHLLSASGGQVSFYTMMTDKVNQETILQYLPSRATFLAYYPHDDDVLAIGLEDSTIAIINDWEKQVVCTLKGHQNRITGLAFSKFLRVLVSLGADDQLCAWRTDQWVRRQLNFVQYQPDGRVPCREGIRVQFHHDQVRLLAVSKSQLVVYRIREQEDARELDHLCQWDLQSPFTAAISDATYSCDSQLVYAGFADGSVGIFDAESFWLRCRLAPPLHRSQGVSGTTYPTTIAANPRRRNEFALGWSDGDVLVVETGEGTGRGEISESDEGVVINDDMEDNRRIEEQGMMARYGCFDYIQYGLKSFLVRYCRAGCFMFATWLTQVCDDPEAFEATQRKNQ